MAESKRRLPLWMLKPKTETKAWGSDTYLKKSEEKSQDQVEKKPVKRKQRRKVSEEKSEDQNEEILVKRQQSRKALNQDPDEFDEAEVELRRCQTRQRNKKAKRKDEVEIGDEKEVNTEAIKRKRTPKRKLVISDDETDLTVDDLVSIAKEYVNSDRDEQKRNTATATIEKHSIKSSLKHVLGPGFTQGLLKCSTSKPSPDSSDHALSKRNNLTEDTSIPSSVAKTGDPAQDMLNLFLGSLLEKPPPVKEVTIKPVETSENSVYREGKNAVEGKEPLAKKKSSLKDKVAMLLS